MKVATVLPQPVLMRLLAIKMQSWLKIGGGLAILAIIGGIWVLRKLVVLSKDVLGYMLLPEYKVLTRNDGLNNHEGRFALIYGADGRIGRAFAIELAKRDFDLILVGHALTELEYLGNEIATNIGVRVVVVQATSDLEDFYQSLFKNTHLYKIQVVVNAEMLRPKLEAG
jgi:hypothetical protein